MMTKKKSQICAILLMGFMLLTTFPFAVFAQDNLKTNISTLEDIDEENGGTAESIESETETNVPNVELDEEEEEELPVIEDIDKENEVEALTPEDHGFKFDVEKKAITEYLGEKGADIVIPSSFLVDGKEVEVEEISEKVFISKKIKSVKLPGTLKRIKKMAFTTNSLTEINLPEGLVEIGEAAFDGNLFKEVTVPSTVEKLGEKAFGTNGIWLKEVTLKEGLKEIGDQAFYQNFKLTELEIPSTVTKIGSKIVTNKSFKEVIINNKKGAVEIADDAFSEGTKITYTKEEPNDEDIDKSNLEEILGIARSTKLEKYPKESQDKIKECIDVAEKGLKNKEITQEEIDKVAKDLEVAINVVPDYMLKKLINKTRNNDFKEERKLDQPIIPEDLDSLDGLSTDYLSEKERWKIKSVEGLQYLKNVTNLCLDETQVIDLSPVGNLTSIKKFTICGFAKPVKNPKYPEAPPLYVETTERAPLEDISPISGMTGLAFVQICDTKVEDISAFKDLKNLEKVHLHRNKISDVSPLKDSSISNQLFLPGNCIGDFSPLKKLLEKGVQVKGSNEGQNVKIKPKSVKFDNPFISLYWSGKENGKSIYKSRYKVFPENEFIEGIGDNGEKLKVVKAPEEGDIIEVEDGLNYPSKLIVDIYNIRDQIENPHPEPQPTIEKEEVYFYILGRQEDVFVGSLKDAKIEVWNDKDESQQHEGTVPYIWNLPKGEYKYKVTHENYIEKEGSFTVKDKENNVIVYLDYNISDPSNYKYPILEELEVVSRVTGETIGKGTINGKIVSVVISDPGKRKLIADEKAELKLKTKNAISGLCVMTETVSDMRHTETNTFPIGYAEGEEERPLALLRPDGMMTLRLQGKGGLENVYGVVLKEKESQKAVIFNAGDDNHFRQLGYFVIPTGRFEGRETYEARKYVQLVDEGKKAVEPLEHIKNTTGKDARLEKVGESFEGWYKDICWQGKFDFDEPIMDDMEIYPRFSKSTDFVNMLDPFTVWFEGPGVRKKLPEEEKDSIKTYFYKDGKYELMTTHPKIKVGEELRFKFDFDDKHTLAFLFASKGGRKIPIEQHEDGSFIFTPMPTQDSGLVTHNKVYFQRMDKKYQKNKFDLNKQYIVQFMTNGPSVFFNYDNMSMPSGLAHYSYAREGNIVPIRIKGTYIDEVTIKTDSGDSVPYKEIGRTNIEGKMNTLDIEFTMPKEDVEVVVKGDYNAPTIDKYFTFKVVDEKGKEIDAKKVKQFEIDTFPYSYKIEDITKPVDIKYNASGRDYNYILSVEDYGTFFGKFRLDKDSPDEVVLTIDTSENIQKTKEDVQRLVDVANGVLENKDKYTTKSIENLESAIKSAEQAIKLQSDYNYAFFKLTNAIDGLEEIVEPTPGSNPTPEPKPESKPTSGSGSSSGTTQKSSLQPKSKKESKQETKNLELEIPTDLKTKKEIKTEIGEIKISPNTFDKEVEKVKLIVKEKDSALQLKVVDEKGKVVKIKKPIEVKMAFKEKVKNSKNVTAVLIKEDGTKESVGGVYNKKNKTIKFLTNKQGKFIVKEGKKEFKDISNVKWAEEAIESMAVKGIIGGKSENNFDPSTNITRAEFAAITSRMLKLNDNTSKDTPFKDVDNSKWYYNSIVAVYENGLINGKSDTIFDPEGNITREEMAKIIGNILENNSYKKQDKKELSKFNDKDSVAPWAEEGAAIAVHNGVIGGAEGKFKPKDNATRAETAVMLYRLYELVMN